MGGSTRILFLLSIEGKVSRARPVGTFASGQYRWAPMETWLERPLPELDHEAASAELLRRWLGTFGPGTMRDIRWWTGWTLGLASKTLDAVGAETVRVGDDIGYVLPDDLDPVDEPEPWVALLPGLDPTTMGWKERDWYLDPRCADAFDSVGNAGPTIWVDGRVVGAWAQRPDGELLTHYFLDVPRRTRAAVEAEAARLHALVGETRFSVRFPSHVQKRLLSGEG